MKIDEIKKLSNLARIKISPKEAKEFTKQLGSILDYVSQIQSYPFSNQKKEKTNQEINLRKDQVEKFNEKEIISQFSNQQDGLLKVKKVL